MLYKDRIYGKIDITELVILDLINSPSIQRLKGIDQAGYSEPWFPGTPRTRFEHSVGVYILLKKYGASLEEQIAGLIHDVSHSAFSHCIDYVLGTKESGKKHDHQDNLFKKFVKKSEIPTILKKHGFNLNYLLEEKNFPLKETELPDICADRIDYSLRDSYAFSKINKKELQYFFDNLTTENYRWVFKNFESAKKFADLFFEMNEEYYAGMPTAVMFATVSEYLKYSLKRKYIVEEDLYKTDNFVLSKIEKHLVANKKLRLLFDRMNNKIKFKNNPRKYNVNIFCKSRMVDPLCSYQGKINRVSEIDKNYLSLLKKYSQPKEYFIQFKD